MWNKMWNGSWVPEIVNSKNCKFDAEIYRLLFNESMQGESCHSNRCQTETIPSCWLWRRKRILEFRNRKWKKEYKPWLSFSLSHFHSLVLSLAPSRYCYCGQRLWRSPFSLTMQWWQQSEFKRFESLLWRGFGAPFPSPGGYDLSKRMKFRNIEMRTTSRHDTMNESQRIKSWAGNSRLMLTIGWCWTEVPQLHRYRISKQKVQKMAAKRTPLCSTVLDVHSGNQKSADRGRS